MSIVRMRKFFRRSIRFRVGRKTFHIGSPVQFIFWLIVLIFVIGAYYSFGPTGRAGGGQEASTAKLSAIIARVGKQTVSRDAFNQALMMSGYDHAGANERAYLKFQIAQQLIDESLQLQGARREGIKVSAREVRAKQDELVDQAIQSMFPERRDLVKYLRKKQMSYEQYKEKIRRERFGDTEAIRRQLLVEKLRESVEGKVTVSDEDLKKSFEEIKVRHLLIRPDQEKKRVEEAAKKSGKAAEGLDGDALARKRAEELLAQIKKGSDFAALAKKYSDDTGSAAQGGDLGWVKRGQMVPEFEAAAFSLKQGEVSGIVKTDFGYHIIKVEGRRQQIPADFEKDKEQYRSQELQSRRSRAWSEYMSKLEREIPVEIVDPEIRAYKLAMEGKTEEAVKALEEAVAQDPTNVDALFRLATLYKDKGDKHRAVELLEQVVQNEQGARMSDARIVLGELLETLGRKKDAIEQYRAASEWAITYEFPNYMIHSRLVEKFKQLGRQDLAEAERKWLDEFDKQQQQQGGMPMLNFGQ